MQKSASTILSQTSDFAACTALPQKEWILNSDMSQDPGLKDLELYIRDGRNPTVRVETDIGLDNSLSVVNN